MWSTTLISKLNKAIKLVGDCEVSMECDSNPEIGYVCIVRNIPGDVRPRIVVTDRPGALYEVYEQDPDNTEMIVEDVI